MREAIQKGIQGVEATLGTMMALNKCHEELQAQVGAAAMEIDSDQEGQHLICISKALHHLHVRVIDMKSIYQSLMDAKGGRGSTLGNNTLQKLFRKIRGPCTNLTKAVSIYDNAVKCYLKEFPFAKDPPALAESSEAVLKRPVGDDFWMSSPLH